MEAEVAHRASRSKPVVWCLARHATMSGVPPSLYGLFESDLKVLSIVEEWRIAVRGSSAISVPGPDGKSSCRGIIAMPQPVVSKFALHDAAGLQLFAAADGWKHTLRLSRYRPHHRSLIHRKPWMHYLLPGSPQYGNLVRSIQIQTSYAAM